MVFISKEKVLHVSAYSGHLQVPTILYYLAENYQNLKMAAIGRNM